MNETYLIRQDLTITNSKVKKLRKEVDHLNTIQKTDILAIYQAIEKLTQQLARQQELIDQLLGKPFD